MGHIRRYRFEFGCIGSTIVEIDGLESCFDFRVSSAHEER